MPARYTVFSTLLAPYRAVLWLAQPVHSRYPQLRSLLQNRFGDDYASLLSEPYIPAPQEQGRVEAKWFTDAFRTGKTLTQLAADERIRVSALLDAKLTNIRQYADELDQSPSAEGSQLAALLRLAIEVPSPDCVLVDGNQIVLVLWGFDSDRSRQDRFRISQFVKSEPLPVSPAPSPTSGVVPPPVIPSNATATVVDSTVPPVVATTRSRFWQFWRWRFWWRNGGLGTTGNAGGPGGGRGFGCAGLLGGLLLLLLLLGLCWWLWPRQWWPSWLPGGPAADIVAPSPHLPPQQGVIPPIDTSQIITDPADSLHKPIVGNRLNMFLKKGQNLVAFVDKIKKQYPGNDLQIVAYDTVYRSLQVQIPTAERDTWRKWFTQMPEVYVVFDETLFETGMNPNDPALSDRQTNWYFTAIQAFTAWDITRGSPDVTVAVLDGGFETGHPELSGQVVSPWNVVTGSNVVNTSDVEGGNHGTHTASTVAGRGGNNEGTSGIAPACRLMPIQVGGAKNISSLAIIYGIQYAMQHGAQVISMSLGSSPAPEIQQKLRAMSPRQLAGFVQMYRQTAHYQSDKLLYERFHAEAARNGIVIVKSAGNDNLPAELDAENAASNIIVVAATGLPDEKGAYPVADFSNYGAFTTVSAPGVKIYNAVTGGGYDAYQGTSMAAPMVAGAVALMKSIRSDLTTDQIRQILIETGLTVSNSRRIVGPMIQLNKALAACGKAPRDPCAMTIDSLRREVRKLRRQQPAI
ncbi:S8 family serine peptidase [Spirosoma fluviale]|uniref:Subtilase family protein n=1 Tax=Spirosoma fluviale TaxID=1597977 RepID=A0A286GXD2_9BACT|nr:S8 family serine peptidase [Spirosoma fluviale]SOD99714.1 Subtilase family protein [Spirosoma fluviale]